MSKNIKAGDLVRHIKHVGIKRPLFKATKVDGILLTLEGVATPQFLGNYEKLVCEVRNDDGEPLL